jgi:hypothetical protein
MTFFVFVRLLVFCVFFFCIDCQRQGTCEECTRKNFCGWCQPTNGKGTCSTFEDCIDSVWDDNSCPRMILIYLFVY